MEAIQWKASVGPHAVSLLLWFHLWCGTHYVFSAVTPPRSLAAQTPPLPSRG